MLLERDGRESSEEMLADCSGWVKEREGKRRGGRGLFHVQFHDLALTLGDADGGLPSVRS